MNARAHHVLATAAILAAVGCGKGVIEARESADAAEDSGAASDASSSSSDASSDTSDAGGEDAFVIPENPLGASYFLSTSDGDDTRTPEQAKSWKTPLRTLAAVHALSSLAPGDAVYLKRGDVFAGPLVVPASGSPGKPITFSSYGAGAKPVIEGFRTATGWSKATTAGVYEVSDPAFGALANLVTLDGVDQPMGRFPKLDAPNGGYLTLQSHVGTSAIRSSMIASIPSFVGGEVVIRKYAWILDRARVTGQTADTVTYAAFVAPSHPSVTYEPRDHMGFFFQNHVLTLTRPGEWAYDASTHTLRMFFGADAPDLHTVRVAATESLVSLSSRSHIRIDGLRLTGSTAAAVRIRTSSDLELANCEVSLSGANAIHVSAEGGSSPRIHLHHNAISQTHNNAIEAASSADWRIHDNTIDDTGMIRGMGISGDGQYNAISYVGSGSVVERNVVRNTGYIGVHYVGDRVLVKNNFFDRFCVVKEDGGAVYTFGERDKTDRRVVDNIALHGVGDRNGTEPGYGGNVWCYYVDGAATNVELSGNTGAFCEGGGIELNGASNVNAHDNTLFDGLVTQLFVNDYSSVLPVRDLRIYNNVFYATKPQQQIYQLFGATGRLAEWGVFDENRYCRPSYEPDGINTPGYVSTDPARNGGGVMEVQHPTEYRFYSLDRWRALSGKDALSKKTPVSVTDPGSVRFEYNATTADKTVPLAGSYVDARGNAYAGSVTLKPYASVILMKN